MDVQVDAQAAPRLGRLPGRLGPVSWADPRVCCGHENPPCGELPPAREAAGQAPSCWWWPRRREPGRELEPPPATAPGGSVGWRTYSPWLRPLGSLVGDGQVVFVLHAASAKYQLSPSSLQLDARDASWPPACQAETPPGDKSTAEQVCARVTPWGSASQSWGAHGRRGHPASPCLQPAGARATPRPGPPASPGRAPQAVDGTRRPPRSPRCFCPRQLCHLLSFPGPAPPPLCVGLV